jgi:hypothetical protein
MHEATTYTLTITKYFKHICSYQIFLCVYMYVSNHNSHEYLIQHSLKIGGTKDHFRWVKVPGTWYHPLLKGRVVLKKIEQ